MVRIAESLTWLHPVVVQKWHLQKKIMEALGGEDIFISYETLMSSKGINSILSKSIEGGACCSSSSHM